MHRHLIRRTSILAIAAGLSVVAAAQPDSGAGRAIVPQLGELSFTQLDRAEGMAASHLNELWRVRALRALKVEDPARALDDFRMAARYADKFSQHSLSLMYWHGVGAERDRALAYVWSDLAAERGYRDLLLVRERMWLEMSAEERRRALEVGPGLYADYGDEVAKPRMEWALRQARANITGSRVGASMDRLEFIYSRGDAAPRDYYAPHRWQADSYWQAEESQWEGRVVVLPVEKVDLEADDRSP